MFGCIGWVVHLLLLRSAYGLRGRQILLLWAYLSLMYCCVQIRVKNDNADNAMICHVIVLSFGWTLTIRE